MQSLGLSQEAGQKPETGASEETAILESMAVAGDIAAMRKLESMQLKNRVESGEAAFDEVADYRVERVKQFGKAAIEKTGGFF